MATEARGRFDMKYYWKRLALGLALAWSAASPAHANWVRADSPHFVVFADDSEKNVARFAENLERFHAAMLLVTGRQDTVPSPSNRVTIFAEGSPRKISWLLGDKSNQAEASTRPEPADRAPSCRTSATLRARTTSR